MKTGYLKLADAIAEMRQTYASGRMRPFSIVYMELDVKRKTGGRIVTLNSAELANGKRSGRSEDRMILLKGPFHPIHVHSDLILYVNDKPVS
jgi:hypothetical protein